MGDELQEDMVENVYELVNEYAVPPTALEQHLAEQWEDRMERPRGILTDTDRRFLWGVKEYPHDTTALNRRGEIRDRFKHGVMDLFYFMLLNESDRRKTLEAVRGDFGDGELREAVVSLIAFLYAGVDNGTDWLEGTVERGVSLGETRLKHSLKNYYVKEESLVDVDITVRHGYDVERIEEQLRAGSADSLTPAEIGILARDGRLDENDLEDIEVTLGTDVDEIEADEE